jgi:hypothetical protein
MDSSMLPHKDTRLESCMRLRGVRSSCCWDRSLSRGSTSPEVWANTAIRLLLHGLRKIFSLSKPVTSDLVHRVRQLYRIESLHLPLRFLTAAVLRTAIKDTNIFPLFNHYEPNWNFMYAFPIQNFIEIAVVLCSRKGRPNTCIRGIHFVRTMRDVCAESLFSDHFIRCMFM